MDDLTCSGNEKHIYDCGHRGWGIHNCAHSEDASLRCSYSTSSIRLKDGGPHYGRVEVYHNGQWGTVCDDSWDSTDANVVCRHIGFSGASSALRNAAFGEGSGRIWMDDVDCQGVYSNLWSCSHSGYGVENCDHSEDASVICRAY